MKTSLALLVHLFLLPVAVAQENVRNLEGPGTHTKYLTPGQVDTWLFDGEKGETVIAHVATNEFDSILELIIKRDGDKEEKFFSIDDPGSDSRFAFRLPEKGHYAIRVHGFEFKGGGNYALNIRRFHAQPLEVGKPLVGALDRSGQSNLYFTGVKDRTLIPDLKGAAGSWTMLDFKGRDMASQFGTVLIAEPGEHYLVLTGRPDNRYELLVREARHHDLVEGKDLAGKLQQGELDEWDFQGKPGEFRLLEVEKKGEVISQVIFAPLDKKEEQRLAGPGDSPEIQFLPVTSRGGRLRFAVLLGRQGRYQLQLLAQTAASYNLKMRDPTMSIDEGKEIAGGLPVSGSAFYGFKAVPGQLFQAGLASQKFVPLLRLYDFRGSLVGRNEDGGDALEGRITHMVLQEGFYRLQVSSLGDGGGGDYRLALRQQTLKELQVGGRGQATLPPGGTDFWSFPGKEGQTVIFAARSPVFQPVIAVRSPDGVQLAGDDGHGGEGSLLALKLPKAGRYTVWVSSRRGAGDYTLRLIED
ncbi:MAG: hypothetical protein ACLP9L_15985 [Thermoguttaceae bacterium]